MAFPETLENELEKHIEREKQRRVLSHLFIDSKMHFPSLLHISQKKIFSPFGEFFFR